MHTSGRIPRTLFLVLIFVVLLTANAQAASFYVRPNENSGFRPGKTWLPVGTANVWEAVDDPITEAQTPTLGDYMEATSFQEEFLGLASMNISGVTNLKATAWYYTSTPSPVEFESTGDATWQTTNTIGWHSRSVAIPSQFALNELRFYFRSPGSLSTPRRVPVAFLKLESAPKVYSGALMDGDVYSPGQGDAPWNSSTWSSFESHAEKKMSIVHFGQPAPWEQPFAPAPLELARAGNTPVSGDGALPLISMGTGCKIGYTCKAHETVAEEEVTRVSLSELIEGKYDSYFKSWAEAVAAYKYPFFLRWAWEMNGPWFKWGRDAAKNPAEYVQAWRHIHNITAAAGATNITWVWCPNVDYLGSTPASQLYPGDAYVDWTCLDGYNRGGTTFISLFNSSYSNITGSVAPTKPLMIGETATTTEGSGHMAQSNWIHEGLGSLPGTFPKIKALVWFNWNIFQEGKEWEWPIEWTSGGQAAFANEISSPYFAGSEFGEPPLLQPIKALP